MGLFDWLLGDKEKDTSKKPKRTRQNQNNVSTIDPTAANIAAASYWSSSGSDSVDVGSSASTGSSADCGSGSYNGGGSFDCGGDAGF